MKKINEKPYELVGFKYSDYKEWCNDNCLKERDPKNKSEFFKQIRKCELVKKNGKLIYFKKEKE